MSDGPHILVVDDHREIRDLVSRALLKDGFRATAVGDGKAMRRALADAHIDLILLDLMLPGEDGLSLCRALRAESDIPIIMLTAKGDEIDRVVGLELGADDYVVKPYGVRELLSRIRALLRRAYGDLAQPAASAPLRYGPLELDPQRMVATLNGEPLELTPIEYRLLHHFLCNPEQPFTRSQLIEQVWGYASEVEAERTVDVHIRHLRQKIEADPGAPRWLVTVRGAGYKLGEG